MQRSKYRKLLNFKNYATKFIYLGAIKCRHNQKIKLILFFRYFHAIRERNNEKNLKNEINKEMTHIGNEAKSFLDRLLGDVSKKSATKQILIGAGSGA